MIRGEEAFASLCGTIARARHSSYVRPARRPHVRSCCLTADAVSVVGFHAVRRTAGVGHRRGKGQSNTMNVPGFPGGPANDPLSRPFPSDPGRTVARESPSRLSRVASHVLPPPCPGAARLARRWPAGRPSPRRFSFHRIAGTPRVRARARNSSDGSCRSLSCTPV